MTEASLVIIWLFFFSCGTNRVTNQSVPFASSTSEAISELVWTTLTFKIGLNAKPNGFDSLSDKRLSLKQRLGENALTTKSDQHLISPYNIIVYKNKRRLKAYENKEIDHKLNTQTS